MNISSDFRKTIEKVMYDKKVKKYEIVEEQDEELNIIKRRSSKDFPYIVCNIQPTSNELIKERYGLDIKAKYCITCSDIDNNLKLGDYIEYSRKLYPQKGLYPSKNLYMPSSKEYQITGLLNFDSHMKVFVDEI